MSRKVPQKTQSKSTEFQPRDFFQTPNYATKLLLPYIPNRFSIVWECASGFGKISTVLEECPKKYSVFCSDIIDKGYTDEVKSFLEYNSCPDGIDVDCIITNPPFSLKDDFVKHAIDLDIPFAFLIPFAMTKWMSIAFQSGCQGLVPDSRINYITPTGLTEDTGHSSYFHSFWLTYKFNLPSQLTFTTITKEMRKDI